MIRSRCSLVVGCAHRTARYKEVRQAGAAWTVRGALCERDARLGPAEGAGGPHALCDRQIENAVLSRTDAHPRLDWIGHGHMRIEERVEESQSGECAAVRLAAMGVRERAGLRSPRGSWCTPERTPTVRPDPGTTVPTARPLRLLMIAITHRREAIWRTLDNPPSVWSSIPTRHPLPALLS